MVYQTIWSFFISNSLDWLRLPFCQFQQPFSKKEAVPSMTPHLNRGILGWRCGNHNYPYMSSILLKFDYNKSFHVKMVSYFTSIALFLDSSKTHAIISISFINSYMGRSQSYTHVYNENSYAIPILCMWAPHSTYFQRKNAPEGVNNHRHQPNQQITTISVTQIEPLFVR